MKIESVKILENEYNVNKKRVSFHLKECLSDSSLKEYLEFCNLMDVCEYLNLKVIFETTNTYYSGKFSIDEKVIFLNLHDNSYKYGFRLISLTLLNNFFCHEIGHFLDKTKYSNRLTNHSQYLRCEKKAWDLGKKLLNYPNTNILNQQIKNHLDSISINK